MELTLQQAKEYFDSIVGEVFQSPAAEQDRAGVHRDIDEARADANDAFVQGDVQQIVALADEIAADWEVDEAVRAAQLAGARASEHEQAGPEVQRAFDRFISLYEQALDGRDMPAYKAEEYRRDAEEAYAEGDAAGIDACSARFDPVEE